MIDAELLAKPYDFHTHSTFSDGDDTPEAMVQAAIAKGLATYGLSDHSCTAFDPGYCMGPRAGHEEAAYRAEVASLKQRYAGEIQLLCGVEQDFYSAPASDDYDYIIGSVHYVEVPNGTPCTRGSSNESQPACATRTAQAESNESHPASSACAAHTAHLAQQTNGTPCVHEDPATGRHFAPIDEAPELFEAAIAECFGGDPYALVEAFFALEARVVEQTNCDIIGHFDLVKKFNGGGADGTPANRFFDERHPRYIEAWQHAADALLATGVPFEINSNGVRSGRTAEMYPSAEIQAYLRERGAVLIDSSDAHKADDIVWRMPSAQA